MEAIKCCLILFTIVCSLITAPSANATDNTSNSDAHWIEINHSFDTNSLNIKRTINNNTYGFNLAKYNQESHFGNIRDRSTDSNSGPYVIELAITQVWRKPFKFGYLSIEAGVGVVKGEWGENCVESSNFYGTSKECDIKDVTTFSVPVEARFAFGKEVGLGMYTHLSLSDFDTIIELGLTLPLGNFTR